MSENHEYQDFLKSTGSRPSRNITEQIFASVRTDLNPNAYRLFAKLLMIHTVTAVATLSVCPQFGFRILSEGMGLMHVFMAFGTYGCFVACGSFFMGTSLLIASLALKPGEIQKIRRNRWLMTGTLTLLSLGVFTMVGPELVFSLTLPWLLGSLIGSIVTLELGWQLRVRFTHNEEARK